MAPTAALAPQDLWWTHSFGCQWIDHLPVANFSISTEVDYPPSWVLVHLSSDESIPIVHEVIALQICLGLGVAEVV